MWRVGESSDQLSSRGGWRGRGRGRGGIAARGAWTTAPFGRGSWKPKPAFTPSPEPPLGSLLFSLSKSDLNQAAKAFKSRSAISGCKTVASYNWLDRTEPTIVVPGKPPRWTPLPEPRELKPDGGEYFRDPNAANYPKHPIEPAVIAALTMDPELAREADVVACGSTLGNLLRFIRGEDKQFRMLVELVGETVFFIRRENTPRELIPGVKGYGHTFPEAYTSWDALVRGSSSHQRVLSYQFGGLDFLVRFEGDGYIADEDDKNNDGHQGLSRPAKLGTDEAVDELSATLADNHVTLSALDNGNLDLKVIHAGSLLQQDRIFELKTRSVRRKEAQTFEDTLKDQLPRLWVAQIPRFILAYHNRGTFEEISVIDVQDDIRAWERDHVDVLSHLAALIDHIIDLTRARPDSKLELRHDAVGILEVRQPLSDAGDALSVSARRLWADGEAALRVGSSDSECRAASLDSSDAGSSDFGWEDRLEPDYTACSAEDCGYCGRCSY